MREADKASFVKKLLIFCSLTVFSFALVVAAAATNPFWTKTTTYNRAQGVFSNLIGGGFPVKTVLPASKRLATGSDIEKLKEGRYIFVRGPAKTVHAQKNELVVYVSGARAFDGYEGKLAQRADYLARQAVKLKAGFFVYCSKQDNYFTSPKSSKTVQYLKKSGIVRIAIFDGGHHLGALESEPDLIVCPVIDAYGYRLVSHGTVRDAVYLNSLTQAVKESTLSTGICTISGFFPLKSDRIMAAKAVEAIISQASAGTREKGKTPSRFRYLQETENIAARQETNVTYAALYVGWCKFPAMGNPPFDKHLKAREELSRQNVELISLPVNSWDIIKSKFLFKKYELKLRRIMNYQDW